MKLNFENESTVLFVILALGALIMFGCASKPVGMLETTSAGEIVGPPEVPAEPPTILTAKGFEHLMDVEEELQAQRELNEVLRTSLVQMLEHHKASLEKFNGATNLCKRYSNCPHEVMVELIEGMLMPLPAFVSGMAAARK